jgi:hypothetical protein
MSTPAEQIVDVAWPRVMAAAKQAGWGWLVLKLIARYGPTILLWALQIGGLFFGPHMADVLDWGSTCPLPDVTDEHRQAMRLGANLCRVKPSQVDGAVRLAFGANPVERIRQANGR